MDSIFYQVNNVYAPLIRKNVKVNADWLFGAVSEQLSWSWHCLWNIPTWLFLCFSLLVNVFIFDFVLPGGGVSTSPSCAPFLDRLAAELSFLQYSEGDNGGSYVSMNNSKTSNDRVSLDDVEMATPFEISMGVESTTAIADTPKGKLCRLPAILVYLLVLPTPSFPSLSCNISFIPIFFVF